MNWQQKSALLGALTWLVLALASIFNLLHLEIIKKLFLLSPLVLIPLGLSLVATPDRHGQYAWPYRAALLMQPFGAAIVIASFLLPQGILAAMLASVWLLVTGLIALFGLARLLSRGIVPAEEACIDAGLIYLVVGGGWLVIARYGLQPLGFGDTIVLLTAVHFHYAGFAAPILAGLAGRMLHESSLWIRRAFRITFVCVVAGTPLVAAGITFSRVLALAGTIVVAIGLLLLAVLIIACIVPRLSSRLPQILLIVSAASSTIAMVLACVYAYSIVTKQLLLNISQMAMTHGIANALGFSLCGLLAWSFIRPKPSTAPSGAPFSQLSSRIYAGPDYFQQSGALSSTKAPPNGLVDNLEVYRRADFNPDSVHPDVRSFYEETNRYRLLVRPHWKVGFRFGGQVVYRLGTWIGQLRLPIAAEKAHDRIESRLLPIEDSVDGRTNVRAWVRTYEGTDQAMYVAAYSTHTFGGNTYMNIAFPLPGGNLTSILHIQSMGTGDGATRGVILSTLRSAYEGGDQGVYFANRLLPIRLPINETIRVCSAEMQDSPFSVSGSTERTATVLARHEMWIFGFKFLELDYEIFPID